MIKEIQKKVDHFFTEKASQKRQEIIIKCVKEALKEDFPIEKYNPIRLNSIADKYKFVKDVFYTSDKKLTNELLEKFYSFFEVELLHDTYRNALTHFKSDVLYVVRYIKSFQNIDALKVHPFCNFFINHNIFKYVIISLIRHNVVSKVDCKWNNDLNPTQIHRNLLILKLSDSNFLKPDFDIKELRIQFDSFFSTKAHYTKLTTLLKVSKDQALGQKDQETYDSFHFLDQVSTELLKEVDKLPT